MVAGMTVQGAEGDLPAGPAGRLLPLLPRWILQVPGVLGAMAVLAFLSWLRLPEVSRGTVWAEDANVFLHEAISLGTVPSITEPYSGYLHVIPRVLAGLAFELAPIDSYALMMSLLSCAAVAAVAVSVFFLSRSMIPQRPLRLMLAMIPVFLPVGPLEVLGNAANLHWYLLWLAPWLLLYQPARWYSKASLFVAALGTATSEILAVLFVPLAVWTIIRRRNFWAAPGLIVGAALQIQVTAVWPRYEGPRPPAGAVEPLSVFYGFVLQAAGSLWETDERTVTSNVVNFGAAALVIPAGVVFCLLAYILVFGRLKWKMMAAYSFGAAAVCWTAAIIVNARPAFNYAAFTTDDWLEQFTFLRYAAAPSMFLLALVPLACAVAAERPGAGSWRPGHAAPALMLLFLLVNYFPSATSRQAGPEWAAGVQAARSACSADPALSSAAVPAAPAGWNLDVPCAVLLKP